MAYRWIVATSVLALACAAALTLGAERGRLRAQSAAPQPTVAHGFAVRVIAHVDEPREMFVTSTGELVVATLTDAVYAIDDAEGNVKPPRVFTRIDDAPVAGVARGGDSLYIGSQHGVWRLPFHDGDRRPEAGPKKIAAVRAGGGRGHMTTSLAFADGRLYASVGSSCNACAETDPTRATVLEMKPDGSELHPKAVHMRNAIALGTNPTTSNVWAGVAGQDELEHGHPYEIFDPVTLHSGTADYGWPTCYENRRAAQPGADCAGMTVSRVVFPAYETPVGVAIYPRNATTHAFPASYRGGAFVALHGSWHKPLVPPRVVFVPLHGDDPTRAVDWNDPSVQWTAFLSGFQSADGSRTGRPTGVAVGPQGSLFVGDDLAGVIYRITPSR
ncbi:MAG: hypothetical protein GIX03_08730 [Candidatus Eremiobacteraeota bacterium]|nr:hypothetical protein [Candidatus Eremiobacteraeota bacterium]MBC5803065.1 hypothetical protein [Candidatus Eremiobacteraeota bacterium]MBC5820513.1 hypothetical protein [Candidatus Eremiobacteraeota bacterium]